MLIMTHPRTAFEVSAYLWLSSQHGIIRKSSKPGENHMNNEFFELDRRAMMQRLAFLLGTQALPGEVLAKLARRDATRRASLMQAGCDC
jgi:hypothetical protein